MEFAQILDSVMKKKNISSYEMSKKTGISDSLIGYWRKGERIPKADNLLIIANFLECSVDYLLGRVDMPNNIYSVSGDNNVQVNGDNCATSISTSTVHSTSDTAELVQLIESLPLVKRAEAIIYLNELKNKIKNHTD